ncbi:MAG: STT3 domain-containing protein [Gammaproteobacteria bacterium]
MDNHQRLYVDFTNKLIALLIIAFIVIFARISSQNLSSLEVRAAQIAIIEATKKNYTDSGKSINLGVEHETIHEIRANPQLWKDRANKLFDELKAQRQYTDPDGNARTYIAGYDSFHWLKLARNIINTGTHCSDAISDPCRNNLSLAPVGHEQDYLALPHVYSITWMHKLISFFQPNIPLEASAMYLSLLLGVLIIIPAFFIGNILTGLWGGVSTAILISFAPLIINRTLAIDTDAWNVLLLLTMIWFTLESFLRENFYSQLWWIFLSGLATGFWAIIWSGWILGYLIILTGLFLHIFVGLIREKNKSLGGNNIQSDFVKDISIAVVYYFTCGLVIFFSSADIDYFHMPVEIYKEIFAVESFVDISEQTTTLNWPNHLKTVAEALSVGIDGLYRAHGGLFLFLLSLVGGLLVLLTYKKNITHRDLKLFSLCLLSYSILVVWTPVTKLQSFILITTPIFIAFFYQLFFDRISDRRSITIPGLIIITLVACLWLAYDYVRLLMFSWIPVAILIAVTITISTKWLNSWINVHYKIPILSIAPLFLFFGIISYAAYPGIKISQTSIPSMSRALQNTAEDIKKLTNENAIVSGLWEYGYWLQYYAERKTSTDGGTLRNHANTWIYRVLASENEREAVGLLRMLNCSSDASALPEGKLSAREVIKSTGYSETEAFRMIRRLSKLDRDDANKFLIRYIKSSEDVTQILNATHCNPPESILITSTEMISQTPTWLNVGLMDPLDSKSEIGHSLRYQTLTEWFDCNENSIIGKYLSCELNLARARDEKLHFLLKVDFSDQDSLVMFKKDNPAKKRKPGLLVIAGENETEMIEPANIDYEDVGFMLLKKNNHVLIADPKVLKSVYTQLQFLDGRYSQYFEKISKHEGMEGESVIAWRVKRWE